MPSRSVLERARRFGRLAGFHPRHDPLPERPWPADVELVASAAREAAVRHGLNASDVSVVKDEWGRWHVQAPKHTATTLTFLAKASEWRVGRMYHPPSYVSTEDAVDIALMRMF